MNDLIRQISDFVWGVPMLVLLVGTGIWLTIVLRWLQFRKLFTALYLALVKRKEEGESEGDISHFQALMTALSATVGTGNIAGVATAIATGGPGALFWMWITGFFGMATKYAEAVLAVHYRVLDEDGTMSGGPMYYLSRGLGQKWLGWLFALFASIAAFGIGNMVQSNSIADVIHSTFRVPHGVTGIILMVATAMVILGGIRQIGKVTSFLVPFMILFYMVGGITVLLIYADRIFPALKMIFTYAFTPAAASGGFLGASVQMAMRMGVARGVFSNESGLGSAPIAAAAAQTRHPVTQALVSMTQTFIDTIVVCTITGLVIIVSGLWNSGDTGATLTSKAFQAGLPGEWGNLIVAVGLLLFAYSTILGWSYYGEKSIEFILGNKAVKPYRLVYVIFVGVGAVSKLDLVWNLADIFNGLMALPNLIGLLGLTGTIVAVTRDWESVYRK